MSKGQSAATPLLSSQAPLLGGGLNLTDRPRRDTAWALAFVLFLAASTLLSAFATAAGFASLSTNAAVAAGAPGASDVCHASSSPAARRRLLAASAASTDRGLVGVAVGTLLFAGLVSLGAGLAFLLLLRKHARPVVTFSYWANVALLVFLGISECVSGTGFGLVIGLITLALGVGLSVGFCFLRDQLELVARLFELSGKAIAENTGLVTACVLINLTAAALVILPLAGLAMSSLLDGSWVAAAPPPQPSSTTTDTAVAASPPPMDSSSSSQAMTCAWQPTGLAVAAATLCLVAAVWAANVAAEGRLFVAALVTARWYAARGAPLPGSPVGEAAALAVTSSFGSLAKGAAILTIAEAIRQAAAALQRDTSNDQLFVRICFFLLASLLNLIASALELFTRFATIRVAITGDAFWESAKASSQLLVRNGLNTISVWWLPPVVLTFTAGVLSAATGLACGLVFGASAEALRAVAGPGAAGAMIGVGSLALFVGVASFLISLLVLLFLSHLVLNVVDTLFYLWAADVDAREVTRTDVHELFELIPSARAPAKQLGPPDASSFV